ncbi:MAG TPA: acyl-CoA dehydrogenase family protein [Streptosporangiaceae bacterium]|nr:acyl-CoA dehydrogenase family protein [Streptosporangiaceae bacterium]
MISFTDEQRLLATTVREALAATCPPDAVRAAGADPAARRGKAWQALGEVGLLGAHVPEEHGGLGLRPMDTVLAFEETGRAAVPGPIVETAVAAPPVLGVVDAAAGWPAKIAAGRAAVSVRTRDVPFLLDADIADLLVVECGGGAALTSPQAAGLVRRASADRTRRLYEEAARAAAGAGSAAGADAEAVRAAFAYAFDHAALAVAAQLLGAARHLLDAAVAHAKRRQQFGRPIGSFQAVKHLLADVAVGVEFAAPVVYGAATTLGAGAPGASGDVSAAKVAAAAAAYRAARAALQVHGAIGYTEELDLHLWLARVWALRTAWGDDRLHRARLRDALLGPAG